MVYIRTGLLLSTGVSKASRIVSHHVYWLSPADDYTSLAQMKPSTVVGKLVGSARDERAQTYTFPFSNTSGQRAFFINPQLVIDGEAIMPCFWSENYFSLADKESMTVTVSCPRKKLNDAPPVLVTQGWNVAKQEMKLP